MKLTILVLVFCLCATLSTAAAKETQLVRYRPITREEYNAILKLTAGKHTISEARLINSGLAVLAGLATWTAGFWPNFLNTFGITQTTTTTAGEEPNVGDNYPLCVIADNNASDGGHNEAENKLPEVDCIIVVRKPAYAVVQEEEEEEGHQQEEEDEEDYPEPEPIHTMPNYNYWPQSAYPVYPSYPYMPHAYQYPPYHSYDNYPSYPSYVYGQQHNFAPPAQFPAQIPFHAHPQPHQPTNSHNNYAAVPQQSQGPIIHVIRGDSRKSNKARKQNRKYTKRELKYGAFHTVDSNGYGTTLFPQQEYRSSYPKVSYSRAAPYNGPVYIMMQ